MTVEFDLEWDGGGCGTEPVEDLHDSPTQVLPAAKPTSVQALALCIESMEAVLKQSKLDAPTVKLLLATIRFAEVAMAHEECEP